MEWKELDFYNLPHDILIGNYEFEWLYDSERTGIFTFKHNRLKEKLLILSDIGYKKYEILYYRKSEPKAPNYEEFIREQYEDLSRTMSEFWNPARKEVERVIKEMIEYLESAGIPPEE